MQIDFHDKYDIIIIGGGAIGSSIALDSASRGLKTLLIEQNDFSSGSSSKSTKLLHGGVRYLEQAIIKLEKKQLNLVFEALKERKHFLDNASFLSKKIGILTPIKKWYELPYYYLGLKIYDLISNNKSLGKTSILTKKQLQESILNIKNFPFAVKYYDGSFNDSKLNISILQTAQKYEAILKNYTQLQAFIYKDSKIKGIQVYDRLNKKEYLFKSNCIINATGHYIDIIRKLDNKNTKDLVEYSRGSHIIISNEKLKIKEAILIPKTSDKRVLFILPWENHILIGTTDIKCEFSKNLKISEEEKDYLLNHINKYFNEKIKKEDILSSWSGIRTLLKQELNSKDIIREHIIETSPTNLISIAGGKWTTARKIAEACMTLAIDKGLVKPLKECITNSIKLHGSYKSKIIIENKKLSENQILMLKNLYGGNIYKVIQIAEEFNAYEKINKNYLYIKAQIIYAIKYEYVKMPLDFLARRIRLAFLNKKECFNSIEYVTNVICDYNNYDKNTKDKLIKNARVELDEIFG